MRRFAGLDDRELTALLAGKPPAGKDELEDLASFFREATTAFEEAPDESTEARHLAAVKQAAQWPALEAAQTTTRRSLMPRNPFSSLAAKIALAAVLVFAAFSGAAYAGALPGPVQRGVADVGGNLGVSLPGADDENDVDDGDQNNVDQGQQNDVDNGPVGQIDEPEKANEDDGPVGDKDDGAQGNTDDGAQGNTDDGAEGDTDDGAQGNTDNGPKDDRDDGAQGNTDDGAQNDRNDDVQEAPQDEGNADAQESPQEQSGEGQGDRGQQGDGDN